MEKHVEAREVREVAAGRWLDVLGALAPALETALNRVGRHVPCPVHGGTDGFRLFRDADLTGGGVCNTCGTFPDGFALLMWVNRWSFPEALRAVAHELGLADGSRPAAEAHDQPPPATARTGPGVGNRSPQPGLGAVHRPSGSSCGAFAGLSEAQRTIRCEAGRRGRALPPGPGLLAAQ